MTGATCLKTRARAVPATPPALADLCIPGPPDGTVVPGVRRRHRRPPAGVVERPRLARQLLNSQAPLVLLVAPAGYGKSVALAAWEVRDERPFAWLVAVAADNDPAHLVASIVGALREVQPLPADLMAAMSPGGAGPSEPLEILTGALQPARRPAVLVIDDAQVLHAPEALAVVMAVAEHQGAGSAVVLASRSDPALPVGRLRAEGLVLELRGADLALTEAEAGTLLRRAGVRLLPDDLGALVRRAEGWPAALQLVGVALRGQEDPSGFAARVRGDIRVVADYVSDTLLAPLPDDAVELLLRVSPLDALSGPLCDAVAQRKGTGAVLRELARSGVPLEPLDESEERFRLHGLVADALRASLRRRDPAGEQEAHRRASVFLERTGELDDAIDHARAAGDPHRLGALVWATASSGLLGGGRAGVVERSLGRLGAAEIATCPQLALVLAGARLRHGDRDATERWTAIAECRLDAVPGEAAPELRAAIATLRAAVARDGMEAMAHDAARGRELAAPESSWRAVACHLEGTALHMLGEPERARVRLQEGARLASIAAPAIRALCLAQLALVALVDEDGDEVRARCDDLRAEITRSELDEPSCALAFAVLAFAGAQAGRIAEAREDVAAARRLAAGLADPPPWYDAQFLLVLARAELRLSDAAAARALLGHAGRPLRQLAEGMLIHTWVDDAWARADTFAIGAVATPSILTIAELRVLRFLPSHLSFREIAARLHVSANTVKTHAHAVYRKLDATSRSGAVARARDVGLIDDN